MTLCGRGKKKDRGAVEQRSGVVVRIPRLHGTNML
jgi:hypothetical protein